VQGEVLIYGQDFRQVNTPYFQKRIGYITQEPVIFNDGIFNNVTFWDTPSFEHISKFNKALRRESIYEFVHEQPKQAETMLGNNGVNISGGQKSVYP
jgi:ABC-type multidrug transport system fused ATPase/permease subunit